MHISPKQTGLTLGVAFAIYHSIWLIAMIVGLSEVLLGWAQQLHFIRFSYELESFDIIRALLGIVSAFTVGYVVGWIFGTIAQKTH